MRDVTVVDVFVLRNKSACFALLRFFLSLESNHGQLIKYAGKLADRLIEQLVGR